ncbi:MAG: hypothetical protein ACI308_02735 [Muribaculaceae bacterium]
MKTVTRNIVLSSLLMMGMVMVTPTVSSQTRERNGRSVSTRTTNNTVNNNRETTVSTPVKSSGNSSNNSAAGIDRAKQNSTVAGRNTSVSTSRPGDKVSTGNKTQNTGTGNKNTNVGNSGASHWPVSSKPAVSNDGRNGAVGTSRPADKIGSTSNPGDLRNGPNARPGTVSGGGYHIDRPESHGSIVNRPSSWSTPVAPPVRTHRPADFIVKRPTAPKGFRPMASAPRITGIFGLLFGATYYSSLDYLFDRGYEIDGYCDNNVYLRNVRELNYFWPDAVIHYSSRGYLENAELYYSTSYDDSSRYTRLYSDLCRTYGSPVSHYTSSKLRETTWYGSDSRGFITLTYRFSNGRFYTSLAYGY